MALLGIEQFMEDGKSCISLEDLQLMDDLQAYLTEKKGETKDFVQACIESGRIDLPNLKSKKKQKSNPEQEAELQPMVESSEIVLSSQQSETAVPSQQQLSPPPQENSEVTFTAPPLSILEQLEAQKQLRISQEDLAQASERGQYRAATKLIAEETLARMFEITQQFTVPGLKEQVNKQRQILKGSRSNQRYVDGANDFLSQIRLMSTLGTIVWPK